MDREFAPLTVSVENTTNGFDQFDWELRRININNPYKFDSSQEVNPSFYVGYQGDYEIVINASNEICAKTRNLQFSLTDPTQISLRSIEISNPTEKLEQLSFKLRRYNCSLSGYSTHDSCYEIYYESTVFAEFAPGQQLSIVDIPTDFFDYECCMEFAFYTAGTGSDADMNVPKYETSFGSQAKQVIEKLPYKGLSQDYFTMRATFQYQ